MKIMIDSTPMEAIGCVQRIDGRITLMVKSTEPFLNLISLFDGAKVITAQRPSKSQTYEGSAHIIGLYRNLDSDTVNITLSGLTEVKA